MRRLVLQLLIVPIWLGAGLVALTYDDGQPTPERRAECAARLTELFEESDTCTCDRHSGDHGGCRQAGHEAKCGYGLCYQD